MTHIMENIIFNELMIRGYHVDIGVVFSREQNVSGHSVRVSREIDFVVTNGGKKTYIQSAFTLSSDEKKAAEIKPFSEAVI